MISWTGTLGQNVSVVIAEPSKIIIKLPSFHNDIDSIQIELTMLISSIRKTEIAKSSNFSQSEVVVFDVPDNISQNLFSQETGNEIRQFYVLAIPLFATSNIYDELNYKRFNFFIVNKLRHLNTFKNAKMKGKLYFPISNELYCSTLSLIWASLWVEQFYSPLFDKRIISNTPKLFQRLREIKHSSYGSKHSDILKLKKDFLIKELPIYRQDLEQDLYNKLFLRVGLGVAFDDVNYRLNTNPDVDCVLTYCPEALYGTVCLWLFSKDYHEFMRISGSKKGSENIRYLPVDDSNSSHNSKIFTCANWLVAHYYDKLEVLVKLVKAPNQEFSPGKDRSYYGGGIGQYPWLTLSPDSCTIDFEDSSLGDSTESLDFIRSIDSETIWTSKLSSSEYQNLFGVKHDYIMKMNIELPLLLFPQEDENIEYPSVIWKK